MTKSVKTTYLMIASIVFIGVTIAVLLSQKQKLPLNQPQSEGAKTGELDISVCDPSNGPFSLNINNRYLPFREGKVAIMEDDTNKVQISVLDQTEEIAGVTTRVVEEREWENGNLAEISRNFFAQTPDGTVCYFGEDVDDYANGKIVGHGGAWRAGENNNKPGIIMPANPVVGQKYFQEMAPGVAEDFAEHVSLEDGFVTPAGTFDDVLVVKETPQSDKRYAPGIGLIFDDGMVLTDY